MKHKVDWSAAVTAATQKSKTAVSTAVETAISSSLETLLSSLPQQEVDMDAILEEVDKRIAVSIKTLAPARESVKKVQVIHPDGAKVDVGAAHKNFATLVRMLGARLNVALIGEAGSGKTHGAEQAAEAMGLPHYTIPFNAKMTNQSLRGYMDAVGNYNPSPLYTAFKNGGVLILDEFEKGNTEVTVCLNSMLAGKSYLFPNGENVTRHEKFLVVACQNTTGVGASKQYAAAQRQDASTLNRFVKLAWDTDEDLERSIAGNTDATDAVQKIRRKAKELGMDIVISPRQSIHANTLMGVGFSLNEALRYSIFECLADDQIKRLKTAL